MRIALDAMGGDLAPKAVIEGAVLAARDLHVEIVLVGDRGTIERELAEHNTRGLAITVEHAAEVVAMDDSPLESVLGKPESSIHVGLDLVKRAKADGFVSAGNSGAVMAATMVVLGTLPGVDRPAIASPVPTTGGLALLIDAGANTDVKPINLMQFGVMGSVYWQLVHKVARPRVGLLSNGEEDSKGTDLTRAGSDALRQMEPHINYIGYVEGRDINRAKADVIVTDGFTGNVALKTMEGFASFMAGNLREVFGGGLLRRLAYLLVRDRLRSIRERLDPAEYGGAPLLGVNGVAFIAHGSSNGRAIRNAVRAAANEALVRQVNAGIVEMLAHSPVGLIAKPSGKGIRGMFLRMRERLSRRRADGTIERRSDKSEKGERPSEAAHGEAAGNHAGGVNHDDEPSVAPAASAHKPATDAAPPVNGAPSATAAQAHHGEALEGEGADVQGRPNHADHDLPAESTVPDKGEHS
ncbi:MAG: phosphate acyltransferase PlsX [Candidatus Binataceae bacterium]